MPTQSDIDKQQDRTKSQSGTIGRVARSGGIYDLSTDSYVPRKKHEQTGKRDIQDDGIDFVPRSRIEDVNSGGGGGNSFTLDVVTDGNVAGVASFNGDGII